MRKLYLNVFGMLILSLGCTGVQASGSIQRAESSLHALTVQAQALVVVAKDNPAAIGAVNMLVAAIDTHAGTALQSAENFDELAKGLDKLESATRASP